MSCRVFIIFVLRWGEAEIRDCDEVNQNLSVRRAFLYLIIQQHESREFHYLLYSTFCDNQGCSLSFFFLRLPLNAFLNLGRSVGVKTNKQERKSEATLKKNQFQGKKRVMLTQFPPTRTESLSYERVSLLFLG